MNEPPYTTRALAAEQAEQLNVLDHTGDIEVVLLLHVQSVVRNPRSSSDTLLIVADALREAATVWRSVQKRAQALLALADKIAAIAPTRATPLG